MDDAQFGLVMAKAMGIDDETADRMRNRWAALPVEWHCEGRHGVVRDVPSAEAGTVQQVIEWHLGNGACRWTRSVNGRRSVEFVHMTKVFPPPDRPWKWCGTTVLFEDWRTQEQQTKTLGRQFKAGDPVEFLFKGARKQGLVAYPNDRSVTVLVAGEGRYRVPPQGLMRTGA